MEHCSPQGMSTNEALNELLETACTSQGKGTGGIKKSKKDL